jgi:hypothetical protein
VVVAVALGILQAAASDYQAVLAVAVVNQLLVHLQHRYLFQQ